MRAYPPRFCRQEPLPQQPFCAQLGNGTCVFVGDDEVFIAEAADLARQQLGCAVFSERAKYELPRHKQSMFNHLPLEERCKATLHLLKDLELLAHADYFVGAPRCWGCGIGRHALLISDHLPLEERCQGPGPAGAQQPLD